MSDYLPEGMRTTAAGLSRQQILQAVGQPKILDTPRFPGHGLRVA